MSLPTHTPARAELEARAARPPLQPGGDRAAYDPTKTASDPRLAPRRARFLEGTSEERKTMPIAAGVMDYFPDAIAAVAEVSYLGNQKHNPGEPLHWSRHKSGDHADCIARHLIERGGFDVDSAGGRIRHSASLAWRALALLQEELEHEQGFAKPRGATGLPPLPPR